MRRLGGWWRLWFAISGLWIVLALGIGIFIIVSAESASDRMKSSMALACPAPQSWKDVIALPAFQRLTPAQQEDARQQYFHDVVVPQLSIPTEIDEAKAQFDAQYGPRASKTSPNFFDQFDTPASTSTATNPFDQFDDHSATVKLSELIDLDRCNSAKHRDYAGEVSKSRADAAIGTVVGATSLPLFLLILGLLTGWVARGFRSGNAKKQDNP